MQKLKKLNKSSEKPLLEQIENDLEQDGVILFDNKNVDEDYLTLPRDLTEINSQELGKYLNSFTTQKMWIRTLIGRVRANLREIEKQLDKVKDRVYGLLPTKLSVKEKELRLANHEEAQELIDKVDYYDQKLQILGEYLDNLVDAIFNISREVTRRLQDTDAENREHSVGKKTWGRKP